MEPLSLQASIELVEKVVRQLIESDTVKYTLGTLESLLSPKQFVEAMTLLIVLQSATVRFNQHI